MKYTIISRDEFIKLIKFGSININMNYIIDEKNRDSRLEELLKLLPYDDEIGFVVIGFTYETIDSFFDLRILIELSIKDIFDIYCLTDMALDFYSSKFDSKIQFKLYPNTKIIDDIELYKIIEDKQKGAKVLYEIFKFDLLRHEEKYSSQYIKEMLSYKRNGYLNQEFKGFYFDLFSYERKNSFFKEDVGIICDLRAIAYLEKRANIELFLSGDMSNFKKEDDATNRDKNIYDLVKESAERIDNDEIKKNFIIGAIFLKSQQLLSTDERDPEYWAVFIDLVNKFKEDFSEETQAGLYHLGFFLGYKYLYEDYYKHLELNIYKNIFTNKILDTHLVIDIKRTSEDENSVQMDNAEKIDTFREDTIINSKMIRLETLAIDSLIDIYYRKDIKRRKVKELKQKYSDQNKDVLINLIMNDVRNLTKYTFPFDN